MNDLNVLLIESDFDNTLLEDGLKNLGYKTLKVQYSLDLLELIKKISPDIIIFNLDSPTAKLFAELKVLNVQAPLPVIMFASDSNIDTINQVIKAEVSAYIIDGMNPDHLSNIINVAIARFKHQHALNLALEEARAKLEDRKQIDRAKAILIKTQNFTEDQAYHTLRKLAMDRNITMSEMAKNVITLSELFK